MFSYNLYWKHEKCFSVRVAKKTIETNGVELYDLHATHEQLFDEEKRR